MVIVHGLVILVMVTAFEAFVWHYNIWNVRERTKAWWKR
jgi:hypothetical protein